MTSSNVDTLIIGGTLVTMNDNFDIIPHGAIAIDQATIIAIGPAVDLQSRYSATETINCPDQVILPGLVNAHTHIPMTLLRGLNDDLRLDVWLGYLMAVEQRFVTPEFVKLGTKLACAEMILSGITSFADMYYFEDHIAQQTAEIGLRALLGQTTITFPTPDAANHDEALALCRQFIANWQGHELIQPGICPHAWYTSTPEQLTQCAQLAQELDVPLHTHIAETSFEVENCHNQNKMTVVEWVAQHGILDTKLLAAHCVHINRTEMDMLAAAKAGIAHNPTSNLKLSSGIAPVAEMLEAGCHVGIGTDGTASNNDLDMFEEMRLAALVAKVKRNDPVDLPAKEALMLATIGGARAIHQSHLTGSLEVGKRADLIVLNTDGVHSWPHFHSNPDAIYSRIVYTAKSTDVAHTMCHGRWLMRDRQLLTVDLPQAQAEAAVVAQQIDQFVTWRDSTSYNKLATLLGSPDAPAQEALDIQIKMHLPPEQVAAIQAKIGRLTPTPATTQTHHDTYLTLANSDQTASYLRIREEQTADGSTHTQITLLGEDEVTTENITLSRSQYQGTADRPLRFYREYFAPSQEYTLQKERHQWVLNHNGTPITINLDLLHSSEDGHPTHFLEIKSTPSSAEAIPLTTQQITQLLTQLNLTQTDSTLTRYLDLL